jgi:hypothetical protein
MSGPDERAESGAMEERNRVDEANRVAVERMMASHPVLKGVARAGEAIPGLETKRVLHAGPPIQWPRMSGPLRGAVIGALIYEGLAESREDAIHLVEQGEIAFSPCHHRGAVGPMAGVTSASMMVYVVEDAVHGRSAFSTLNEG